MIALDTNVLVRLILQDNTDELQAALELIDNNACFVGWPVLIELCWVLERSAMLPRADVSIGLNFVLGLKNVTVPEARDLEWVLERYADGADFADMVHLVASATTASVFATFDRKLGRQAGEQVPIEVLTLRGLSR